MTLQHFSGKRVAIHLLFCNILPSTFLLLQYLSVIAYTYFSAKTLHLDSEVGPRIILASCAKLGVYDCFFLNKSGNKAIDFIEIIKFYIHHLKYFLNTSTFKFYRAYKNKHHVG
jgi:uncharacterized protein YodC (DUF2158 family)